VSVLLDTHFWIWWVTGQDTLTRAERQGFFRPPPPVVQLLPLDVSVLLALNNLPSSFHGDPADRIIVATARARYLPLATRDRRIRRSRAVRLWTAGN
jgi:PIN domain nuclease of toxin-antitoxin system